MNGFFGGLAALGVATLFALWLVFFPEVRDAWWRRIARFGSATSARAARTLQRSGTRLRDHSLDAHAHAASAGQRLREHWVLLTLLAALLVAPPVLVLGLHRHVALDGYDMSQPLDAGTTALVANLLRGERLVPPPPLPPAVFVTPEVEKLIPHIATANRKWAKLNPEFQQRLLAVFKIMQARYGYQMALIEGYRSPARQAQLEAEGSNVTHAGAYQSYHQFGLAADCAFYRDGKLVIRERNDPWAQRGYALYGKVAEAAGLVWGGSWKMRDLGHVELHVPGLGPRAYRARMERAKRE